MEVLLFGLIVGEPPFQVTPGDTEFAKKVRGDSQRDLGVRHQHRVLCALGHAEQRLSQFIRRSMLRAN
ncbi:hypothetical protein D3C72_2082520 [compost metagenome]